MRHYVNMPLTILDADKVLKSDACMRTHLYIYFESTKKDRTINFKRYGALECKQGTLPNSRRKITEKLGYIDNAVQTINRRLFDYGILSYTKAPNGLKIVKTTAVPDADLRYLRIELPLPLDYLIDNIDVWRVYVYLMMMAQDENFYWASEQFNRGQTVLKIEKIATALAIKKYRVQQILRELQACGAIVYRKFRKQGLLFSMNLYPDSKFEEKYVEQPRNVEKSTEKEEVVIPPTIIGDAIKKYYLGRRGIADMNLLKSIVIEVTNYLETDLPNFNVDGFPSLMEKYQNEHSSNYPNAKLIINFIRDQYEKEQQELEKISNENKNLEKLKKEEDEFLQNLSSCRFALFIYDYYKEHGHVPYCDPSQIQAIYYFVAPNFGFHVPNLGEIEKIGDSDPFGRGKWDNKTRGMAILLEEFFKKKECNEIMGKFEAKYHGFTDWLDENPLKVISSVSA